MSESPRTSGHPGLSRTGHPETGDSGPESNPKRQEWDQSQQPRRTIAETANAPPQYLPHPHPEAHPSTQGQHSVPMPAQRSPFAAQAAFTPPRAPKRPKAHVLSACVNCKKAHLSCDGTCHSLYVSPSIFGSDSIVPTSKPKAVVQFIPSSNPRMLAASHSNADIIGIAWAASFDWFAMKIYI
ncbi:MAG: hypothetical protein M1813_004907 [Trichoglossum hirsutum]|nr:MAG: hypothetical protein M1813_004907 [Trichoglossum hirsutum]